MKELQKYYANLNHELSADTITPRQPLYSQVVYLASEADAAFAEMRREHETDIVCKNSEILALKREHATDKDFALAEQAGYLRRLHDLEIEKLKREHAEEIERRRSQADALQRINSEHIANLRADRDSWKKQAEIQAESLRVAQLQAERYEKLCMVSTEQFDVLKQRTLGMWSDTPLCESFDSLVDQLPASGEEQK